MNERSAEILLKQIAETKKSLAKRPEWMKQIEGFEGYRYQENMLSAEQHERMLADYYRTERDDQLREITNEREAMVPTVERLEYDDE